jgi:hypothetical protein
MYTVKTQFKSAKGIQFVKGQTVEVIQVIGESKVKMVRIYNEDGDNFFTLKSIADRILINN